MRAYFYDNLPGDPRLPHDSRQPVSAELLEKIKVNHWTAPVEVYQEKIDDMAKERGYPNRDAFAVSREALGDLFEEKTNVLFNEHIHDEGEELFFILSGSGFFDVRELPSEAWIRLAVKEGDLVVFPAGIYRRFTVDEKNIILGVRLYQGQEYERPKQDSYHRSADDEFNPLRDQFTQGVESAQEAGVRIPVDLIGRQDFQASY